MSDKKPLASKACRKVGVMNTKIAAIISNTRDDKTRMDVRKVNRLAVVLNNILNLMVNIELTNDEKSTELAEITMMMASLSREQLNPADAMVALLAVTSTSLIKLSDSRNWATCDSLGGDMTDSIEALMREVTKKQEDDNDE